MTSNTQTSNIMASVDKAFDLYMVEVASQLDLSDEAIGAMKRLWQPRREELAESCAKKKTKRNRSSSGKKRAKSAYMFFCAEMRETLKTEQPDLKGRDVMTELGKRWKEAKQGDTSKWDELAKQDKERVVSETDDESTPTKKTKKTKTKTKPKSKKAKSAYMFFCAEKRLKLKEESPEMSAKDIMVALGKSWKEAKQGDTSKWDELAKQDKERVKAEAAEETKAETNTKAEETKAEADSEGEESPKKKSSSPKKSSPKKRVYPYNFWAKLHRGEIGSSTGLKGKELTKALREKWKELPKEEKAEWKESAIKAAED